MEILLVIIGAGFAFVMIARYRIPRGIPLFPWYEKRKAQKAMAELNAQKREEMVYKLNVINSQLEVYYNQLEYLTRLAEMQRNNPYTVTSESKLKKAIATQKQIGAVQNKILMLEEKKRKIKS